MSRLQSLFDNKQTPVLNIYITAGYPNLTDTVPIMESLQESGADIIEVGIPYSDPLADGETIQQSSMVSLANGMSIAVLLGQLKTFRTSIHLPVVLMGYWNPIVQFGVEQFCEKVASVGIDGLIIPDLPLIEFEKEYGSIFKKYGLDFIFLVTPSTPETRLLQLDAASSGFLYAVSSSATTGTAIQEQSIKNYLQKLQSLPLKNPVLVGFGIHDKASFDLVASYSRGGIIGSAFIKALGKGNNVKESVTRFISRILGSKQH